MTKKPVRRYQLDVSRIEDIEDIKKILSIMLIRIDTDNPEYKNVKDFFTTEVVPRGYMKLLKKVGHDAIAKMELSEIEFRASQLLNESENNEETD